MPLPASIEAASIADGPTTRPTATARRRCQRGRHTARTAGRRCGSRRRPPRQVARDPAHEVLARRIQRWIGDGHVRIDDRVATARDAVRPGNQVGVETQPSDEDTAFVAEDAPLEIVHEDDALIVIDKPAGLVVHPAAGNWRGTLLKGSPSRAGARRGAARRHRPSARQGHDRADGRRQDARGADRSRASAAGAQRRRTYLAIVHGTPSPRAGSTADRPRSARSNADTSFKLPRRASRSAQARSRPRPASRRSRRSRSQGTRRIASGLQAGDRPHASDPRPPAGDRACAGRRPTYGRAGGPIPFGRQALHAWRLALLHPTTGASMAWRPRCRPTWPSSHDRSACRRNPRPRRMAEGHRSIHAGSCRPGLRRPASRRS